MSVQLLFMLVVATRLTLVSHTVLSILKSLPIQDCQSYRLLPDSLLLLQYDSELVCIIL